MLYLEARLSTGIGRWPVRGDRFVIGREPGCDVVILDNSISRRHLRVTVDDEDKFLLEDLESTNGLHVGGKRLERAEIRPDEWFVIGTVMMTIREGVSLTSSDGDVSADEHGGLPVEVRMTPPQGSRATEAGDDTPDESRARLAALEGLATNLDQASDSDLALQALLDFVADFRGTLGGILIEKFGNGWVLRAQSGEAVPAESEEAFLEAASQADAGTVSLRSGTILGWRVARPDGPVVWLAVNPWHDEEQVPPEFRLVASLCGLCLSRKDERLREEAPKVADEPVSRYNSGEFVTVAASCRTMLGELDRISATELPVLLRGESGTGKELLARRVHANSPRSATRFLAINCAALPRELLEAELFGIERGVATGVSPRHGHLQLASGGTLLLDEIGEMPLELQPKLLRALESGEIIPLGAPAPVPVDVRLVSATNIDLEAKVKAGGFRRDLFHRIAGATVHVPPLRERPEDVLPLARLFIRECALALGRPFVGVDLGTARCLIGYDWPGNVRELRHALARAVALADGAIIHSGLLPEGIATNTDPVRADAYLGLKGDFRGARQRFEHLYFSQLLERCEGNLSEASRLAKLTRGHLYTKLSELGIKK